MSKTVICLHASAANIEVINKAFHNSSFQLQHIVDAQLMKLIQQGASSQRLQQKIQSQLDDIVALNPDFILITCTNYIAVLDEVKWISDIPILKIDELLFEQLQSTQKPIKILFSNEATVAGTMKRLRAYCQQELDIEVIVVPEIFELYLAGDTLRHDQLLFNALQELDTFENTVVVAQLSMAKVAQIYSRLHKNEIINPITAVEQYLQHQQLENH